MSRIRLLELSDMDPEMAGIVRTVEEMTGDSTAMRAVAHRPDIVKAFGPFYWTLQMEGLLDRKLIELVRLSIAQINQCRNCLGSRYQDSIDQGLTEEMVAAQAAGLDVEAHFATPIASIGSCTAKARRNASRS